MKVTKIFDVSDADNNLQTERDLQHHDETNLQVELDDYHYHHSRHLPHLHDAQQNQQGIFIIILQKYIKFLAIIFLRSLHE